MWKVTNIRNGSIMTVYDSKGKGHTLKAQESVIIDKEPMRETPSMVIEEVDKKVVEEKPKKVEIKVKKKEEDN